MKTTESIQLEFIAYIQRLLVEGDFYATYKYALLHSLADLSIEKSVEPNCSLLINDDELIEKFIQIYWQHAKPFASQVLFQSPGKQAKIITDIAHLHSLDIKNIYQAKKSKHWPKIYSNTKKALKDGPLWRLQVLAKQVDCFLYKHDRSAQFIVLNPGIADCFRKFHDLIIHLTRQAWLNKVFEISGNQQIIGLGSQVQDFLFGVNRKSIVKAVPILQEIQKGCCFYCKMPIKSNPEVDHFIPFSKYPNDLGHNFVLAHRACNNNKRDYLASENHKNNWYTQNIVLNKQLIEQELSAYFNCDKERAIEVVNWAYQTAESNHSKLWVSKNTYL